MKKQVAKIQAIGTVTHNKFLGYGPDGTALYEPGVPEVIKNLVTDVGRVYLHTQIFGTSSANVFQYIALSNDALGETASSTVLSNEITLNNLGRALGTVTLPTGSGTITTVAKTFTASGAQSCQKAALFTAAAVGTMNHVLAFTQRNLILNDTIAITFSITIS